MDLALNIYGVQTVHIATIVTKEFIQGCCMCS